jgi:hypothetical protein
MAGSGRRTSQRALDDAEVGYVAQKVGGTSCIRIPVLLLTWSRRPANVPINVSICFPPVRQGDGDHFNRFRVRGIAIFVWAHCSNICLVLGEDCGGAATNSGF